MHDFARAFAPAATGPSPESVLRAIFVQAFARQPLQLPAGATADTLRAALALDPAIMAALYQDAKFQIHPPQSALAAEPECKGDVEPAPPERFPLRLKLPDPVLSAIQEPEPKPNPGPLAFTAYPHATRLRFLPHDLPPRSLSTPGLGSPSGEPLPSDLDLPEFLRATLREAALLQPEPAPAPPAEVAKPLGALLYPTHAPSMPPVAPEPLPAAAARAPKPSPPAAEKAKPLRMLPAPRPAPVTRQFQKPPPTITESPLAVIIHPRNAAPGPAEDEAAPAILLALLLPARKPWTALLASIAAVALAVILIRHQVSTPPPVPPPAPKIVQTSPLNPPPPLVPTVAVYAKAINDKAAFSTLASRAIAGKADAAFDLATLVDPTLMPEETAIPKNAAQAFHWYQVAAAAGYPPAETNLAHDYQDGQGTETNDALAAKWYQAAANSGLANAQNSLGFLYQYGLGVPQNDALAVQWFQKAALQGFALAQNNLAAAYEAGTGVPQNFAEAAVWLQTAAARGEPNSENRLGYLYYNGLGVTQNNALAMHWFAAAAAQGFAPAQLNLGLFFEQGLGVKQDNVEAAKWYMLAAERGDDQGQAALTQLAPSLSQAQLATAQAEAKAWDLARK